LNATDKSVGGDASLSANLSRVSSQNVEESLEIIYDGLARLNYNKIGDYLNSIITELELNAVAILFDEWSYIKIEHQPLLAQIIRTTLIPVRPGERKMFIKFACIPFLTSLSTTKENSQPIGFPVGEEIFVDVDLDRIYNAFADPETNTIFLLSVLQKHLGYYISELGKETDFSRVYNYFRKDLFKEEKGIAELVLASAGVPRDFLRIFVKAFLIAPDQIPISSDRIRLATHQIFQDEKRNLVEGVINLKLSHYLIVFIIRFACLLKPIFSLYLKRTAKIGYCVNYGITD
jgi:hypothetical protein